MISGVLAQVMLSEHDSQVTKNDDRERNVKEKRERPKGRNEANRTKDQ
jgi:hypothetical protein